MVRSLRASLSASSREIDGTLKKLKDKKERVAAAEAKPKKADKVGAGTRYIDKAGTTIFDLDWGSTTLGGKPVEFVADPRLVRHAMFVANFVLPLLQKQCTCCGTCSFGLGSLAEIERDAERLREQREREPWSLDLRLQAFHGHTFQNRKVWKHSGSRST